MQQRDGLRRWTEVKRRALWSHQGWSRNEFSWVPTQGLQTFSPNPCWCPASLLCFTECFNQLCHHPQMWDLVNVQLVFISFCTVYEYGTETLQVVRFAAATVFLHRKQRYTTVNQRLHSGFSPRFSAAVFTVLTWFIGEDEAACAHCQRSRRWVL